MIRRSLSRTWFLWAVAAIWACSDDGPAGPDDGGQPPLNTVTCIGCHASETALKAALGTAKSLTVPIIADGDG
jgi:hypothetical protein